MIVIQLAFILIFAFMLRIIFIYIDSNITELTNGNTLISKIVMWLMISNVAIILFIVLYNYYQTEWMLIGKVGKAGPDGQKGDQGLVGCSKKNQEHEFC